MPFPDPMTQPNEAAAKGLPTGAGGEPAANGGKLVLTILALLACFSWPLFGLVRFSIHDDLYSHIVLVPLISLYLVWNDRPALARRSAPDCRLAAVLLAAG